MAYYDPYLVTLRLSQEFMRTLQQEVEWAQLVQHVHTIIPDSLIRLATIVLTEADLPLDRSTPDAIENRQKSQSDF